MEVSITPPVARARAAGAFFFAALEKNIYQGESIRREKYLPLIAESNILRIWIFLSFFWIFLGIGC